MCDGVFIASAYRCLSGFLVFRDAPQESVGNRAVEDGSPDHEPRRADKPKNICECSGPIKLCLDFRRGHVAGKLIDVESDVGGYAQDGCRFCNQWCPHKAATKLLLLALPCGRNRRACGEFGRRPENRKFMLDEAEGCGILCQKRIQIPFECPTVRAAEFTEVCDWDDFRRQRGAKQRSAEVCPQCVGTRASLDGHALKGAYGGIPFPVVKTGLEAMWNHKLAWRGTAWEAQLSQYQITADGKVVLTTDGTIRQRIDFGSIRCPGRSPASEPLSELKV